MSKEPAKFGLTLTISPRNFKVTDEDDSILFDCPAELVRGVIDIVSKAVDEDIPAWVHENGADPSDFWVHVTLKGVPCKEMILYE